MPCYETDPGVNGVSVNGNGDLGQVKVDVTSVTVSDTAIGPDTSRVFWAFDVLSQPQVYPQASFWSGGSFVGSNSATPPKPTIPQRVETFVCKESLADRIFASVKQGAIVGAIRGGASGFIGGEIAEPLGGGIPGAILGGFLGGTIGAAGGVFAGSVIAIGCSLAGAY